MVATQNIDNYNRHQALCKSSHHYPKTLLRPSRPHEVHALNKHVDYMGNHDEDLFGGDENLVDFFEIDAKRPLDPIERSFHDTQSQVQHMQNMSHLWDIRHVFFGAADSRAPLNCSADMMKSVFTFHQVEYSFLESLYTFGDQEKPRDLCLANFESSDSLDQDVEKIAIPQLGRTGWEIRVSYLLRSMEYVPEPGKQWNWKPRQTAVYHSFDIRSGQSFWCTIKANDEFKNRIKESTSTFKLPKTNSLRGEAAVQLFVVTLSTHLIYLSWCDENWRWCINDMERSINEILEKARMAPIDNDESTMLPGLKQILVRKGTMNSRVSRNNSMRIAPAPLNQPILVSANGISKVLRWAKSPMSEKKLKQDIEKGRVPDPRDQKDIGLNHLVTLDEFRVGELQNLHVWGERIQRSILTVQLSINVLNEIAAYYTSVMDGIVALHGESTRKHYELETSYFKKEIMKIIRGLETRKLQLESLASQISEGYKLYDGLLQYRNLQISQVFSENARESAEKMESIAYKTAQETASMHIITVVTLIFLPGTFVATFFQSGVFLWNDDPPEKMASTWSYRADAFRFFSWLCFPMMAATLLVWLTVWLKMKRNRHKALRVDEKTTKN